MRDRRSSGWESRPRPGFLGGRARRRHMDEISQPSGAPSSCPRGPTPRELETAVRRGRSPAGASEPDPGSWRWARSPLAARPTSTLDQVDDRWPSPNTPRARTSHQQLHDSDLPARTSHQQLHSPDLPARTGTAPGSLWITRVKERGPVDPMLRPSGCQETQPVDPDPAVHVRSHLHGPYTVHRARSPAGCAPPYPEPCSRTLLACSTLSGRMSSGLGGRGGAPGDRWPTGPRSAGLLAHSWSGASPRAPPRTNSGGAGW